MSTVAKKVIMGSGAVESAYEIEQSAIFNKSSIDYLVRTPSSDGNRKTWTLSAWLKRTDISETGNANGYQIIYGGQAAHETTIRFVDNSLEIYSWTGSAYEFNWVTTRKFRDPSAWFHLVVAFDSTQGTNTNRIKVYIDGEQETPTTIAYPDQNLDTRMNLASVTQYIGRYYTTTSGVYLNYAGCMAEFNWLDGTAAAPSSFGETNSATGQWIPKEYSGSYGTNGFYLKFVSGAIGTDSSGEGNNYTVDNLSNSDIVIDTPTNNFATLNPIFISGDTNTFSEGNLKVVMASTGGGLAVATIVPTAGKYYAEFKMTAGDPSYGYMGVTPVTTNSKAPAYMTAANNSYAYYGYNGQIIEYPNDTVLSTEASYGVNDVVGIAIDYDNSTIKWYKNNALQYTKTSAVLTDVTFGIGDTSGGAGQTVEVNFGQKAFAYTPPSGYVALSTANLPDPAIPLPSAQFNTALYAGAGQTQTVTGVGFQPDFVWIKNRSEASYHNLMDVVRGIGSTTKALFTNSDDAEASLGSGTNKVSAVNSNGFVIDGNSNDLNHSSENYVSWNWKADGSGSTDTSGDIDAVVSANQAAGFSIVTWTATGSNTATVPHGLGVTPEIIFYKTRSTSGNWNTWTTAIDGSNDSLLLNTTAAKSDNSGIYGNLTSSFFPNWGLGNNITMVAYAFASKPGYSKIGVYTGNGSAADGPFVNTGFKPALVIRKRATTVADWFIYDAKINPVNSSATGTGVSNISLWANTTSADEPNGDAAYGLDILSNGFKTTTAANYLNYGNDVYLYIAFAEAPFKYANAR